MASFKQIRFYLLLLSGIAISIIGVYIFFTSSIVSSLLNILQLSYTPDVYHKLFNGLTASKSLTISDNGNQYTLTVAVADTETKRENGLMNVTSLPQDQGMLFIFQDGEQVRSFWMKDTKIPLDMIFFDANKNVVHIQQSAQPCTADPCPIYSSEFPAEYVLEVNGGWSASHQINLNAKGIF